MDTAVRRSNSAKEMTAIKIHLAKERDAAKTVRVTAATLSDYASTPSINPVLVSVRRDTGSHRHFICMGIGFSCRNSSVTPPTCSEHRGNNFHHHPRPPPLSHSRHAHMALEGRKLSHRHETCNGRCRCHRCNHTDLSCVHRSARIATRHWDRDQRPLSFSANPENYCNRLVTDLCVDDEADEGLGP